MQVGPGLGVVAQGILAQRCMTWLVPRKRLREIPEMIIRMSQTEAGEAEADEERARSQMHKIGASNQMHKVRACKKRGQGGSGILVWGGAACANWW